jgi:hypothetical protein
MVAVLRSTLNHIPLICKCSNCCCLQFKHVYFMVASGIRSFKFEYMKRKKKIWNDNATDWLWPLLTWRIVCLHIHGHVSRQMTLQWFSAYDSMRFLVRDDPKLSDDSGRVPKPNRVVDGLICNCEFVSLLGGNLPGGQVPLVYLKNKK